MSFNVTNCITKTLSLIDANITFPGESFEEGVNNLIKALKLFNKANY